MYVPTRADGRMSRSLFVDLASETLLQKSQRYIPLEKYCQGTHPLLVIYMSYRDTLRVRGFFLSLSLSLCLHPSLS